MHKDPTSSGARPDSDGASTLDLSGRCVGSSYILIRPIGQGATGTVWRGVDRASGEPVAVKLLHESLLRQPKLVTRFVQERTILLMLRHRNVVRVRDLFSVGESLGLVMDLVPGGSLREHLRKHHTVPAGEAARLASQVAAALAEAHELGIVHRDLKPDNILLQIEDGRLDTRLTDFGIARVLNTPALTTPNAVVGTPHYMSPEAFHGATANPAADVYALGILLYEMVSGHPPYDSDSVADLMRRHLEGDPERRPGIPDALWTVLKSCLERKPRLRPTAAELVAELEGVARSAAGAPALPPPLPVRKEPEGGSSSKLGPSLKRSVIPAPRVPRRRNQVPSWRWARPGTIFAMVAGTMLASGVATTAWHLTRAGGTTRDIVVAAGPAAAPSRPATTPGTTVSRAATARPPAPASIAPDPVRAADPAATTKPGAPERVPARTVRPAAKAPQPEARVYGPWNCMRKIAIGSGSDPLLASPCQSSGPKVQFKAVVAAPTGGTATVSVSLRSGGRTVAGPYTCANLVFREGAVTRECGPREAGAIRGRTYVVAMSWEYTREGRIARGETTGSAFTF
ncbi:MAG TPA: serine/threonine-protein kinase [Actinoplanes sp.]|nr:serine/threonine-protein kinase [Actinoplanes sp.]